MIRDPSDGSVRETEENSDLSRPPMPVSKPGMTSALPTASQKPKDLARLEASRAWLKHYHGTGE